MAFVFELPEVGEGVVEAEVVSWNVKEGDFVRVDQPLCEITTDKAQLEISSPKAGRVVKLHGKPGDIIKVHAPLVEIDTEATNGVGAAHAPPAPSAPPPVPQAPPPATLSPAPRAPAPPAVSAPPQAPAGPTPTGPTRAAPAVRREAREMGLDIHQVSGTGPGGRVTRGDLHVAEQVAKGALPPWISPAGDTSDPRVITNPKGAASPAPRLPAALPQVAAVPSGAEERVRIIGIRRKIAEQMRKSRQTAAHFTYVEEVDCGELVTLREWLKKLGAAHGIKVTYMPIMLKATSMVLRDFPNLNAVMDEENFELVVKGDHNIGISTDTPNGLYVPVLRNVEQKPILQLAQEMDELLNRTKAGKAKLEELRGGTFTITSVGSIGGVFATPILNIPEVAILGVNAIRERAVVRDGQIVVRPMMYLSPSFDHRVIDGAVGARFIAALKDLLEHPERLLMEIR